MRERRHKESLAFVLVLLMLTAGCSRPADRSGISVEARFSPEPARVGKQTVTLTLKDSSGQPVVSGAHITVEANMSHPGMAPVFADARDIGSGRYEAELDLGMPGSWVVLVHVHLSSGEKIERQLALEVKAH